MPTAYVSRALAAIERTQGVVTDPQGAYAFIGGPNYNARTDPGSGYQSSGAAMTAHNSTKGAAMLPCQPKQPEGKIRIGPHATRAFGHMA